MPEHPTFKALEVITVTDKFVGFVRCKNNNQWSWAYGNYSEYDAYFVAFNADREIDELFEADITWEQQEYEDYSNSNVFISDYETFTEPQTIEKTLLGEEVVLQTAIGTKYEWKDIMRTSEFLDIAFVEQNLYSGLLFNVSVENKITDEGLTALQNKQWVLNFTTTRYSENFIMSQTGQTWEARTNYSLIENVSILRLKFRCGNDVYNLGTIDNKQTGSNVPINEEETKKTINLPAFENLLDEVQNFLAQFGEVMRVIIIVLGVILIILFIRTTVGFIKDIFS